MRINIYGVGRSGTKALQLYLAYIIAKNEGNVHVNYEPYNFVTRRGPLNYTGIYHNYNSDLFVDDESMLRKGHRNFIRAFSRNTPGSIITKFVHANGRISAINQIMKPDLTIIIIRDLFESLNSLARMKWDYLSFGYFLLRNTYINTWEKLVEESRKLDNTRQQSMRNVNDIYHMNAFYWYFMNLAAISSKDERTVIINYDDIQKLPLLLTKHFPYPLDEHIRSERFVGTNMHRDWPLVETDKLAFGSLLNRIKLKLNEINFYLFKNKSAPIFPFKVGSRVKLSPAKNNMPRKYEERYHVSIQVDKTRMLQELNENIIVNIK